ELEMSDHFDPNRKSAGAAKILAKKKEADALRAAADKITKICPPPPGKTATGGGGTGGGTTGPGKGKPKKERTRTGHNVSFEGGPEDDFCALISEDKIKIDSSGTGETIGHV